MSKISEALSLLNSMVLSGESHSEVSQKALADAYQELKYMTTRLRDYHSQEPFTGEDLKHDDRNDGLAGIVRWVKETKQQIANDPEGGIFDTGFRCVSEGGETFYFDPEELEELWDRTGQATAIRRTPTQIIQQALTAELSSLLSQCTPEQQERFHHLFQGPVSEFTEGTLKTAIDLCHRTLKKNAEGRVRDA